MKSLILAEKPSVAREMARVLGLKDKHKHYIEGPNYVVTWALGHLLELKMPEDYDKAYQTWKMEDLPIIPKHMGIKVIKQTAHHFKGIEQLAKRDDLKELIIATDAGREGELVARWIIKRLRWTKPLKRLWISSQTDQAIREGFRTLKPAGNYESLYESAVCRAEADWLIGLNVTRALTTKYNDPLSAGRVQTPTLAMIVDREKKILGFVPKPYWSLKAQIGPVTAVFERDGEKRLFNEAEAHELEEKLKNQSAQLTTLKSQIKKEAQPLPYDLTDLQRDANIRFGFSAKKTLNVLQGLYEHHKIVTYPRTDSRYLTEDMRSTMGDRLKAVAHAYKEEAQPLLRNKGGRVQAERVFNNSRVTDHHAIIPTEEPAFLRDLTSDEAKLYELIVRRFLALFMSPYQYKSYQAVFTCQSETFTASETETVDLGYRRVTHPQESVKQAGFSELKEGKTYTIQNLSLSSHTTEPPSRLSEADLLKRMEKYGLGTPATRAEIIERLIQNQSIDRRNGRLFPTPKGKQLIDLVNEDLKSPKLTAKWERELESIARGKGNRADFMANILEQTKKLINEVKNSDQHYRAHNLTGSKCPECGELMKEVKGKDGRILVCSNQECRYRRRKDPKLSNRRCPTCHKKMEIHNGKAGTYFQCRTCNIVEKATDKKKNVSKHEARKLLKKYSPDDGGLGNPLADALKAAMETKDE
ncbi:DNA topoisomerase III [Pullulanibacillus sp. KACC 23026]|uniref:DNA topoisomerase III n=1 Tax=Pullulanibacillus sp. KACC 23026 TaxID=3028315 RepID=UPI0023AEEEFB|nr:DNA topoisomerase III [Pullulanibacillus sp. KACC 23026]WEG11786.1 DNA topoisomerase III [Pullulanibacillus sp. KACC 23026]